MSSSPAGISAISLAAEGVLAEEPLAEVLGTVPSICSTCLEPLTAEVIERDGAVWLRKTCARHGIELVLESSTREFYRITPVRNPNGLAPVSECAPGGSCCRPGSTSAEAEYGVRLEGEPIGPSCVALFEITDRCNLECPLCFAGSGPGHGYLMSLEEFRHRLELVLDRRGALDIVMLSGGEPTVHPELDAFLEILDECDRVGRVLLNTNGMLIGRSDRTRELLDRRRRKLEIYLQFDSLIEARVTELRGERSLVAQKREALSTLRSLNLPTTFATAVRTDTSSEELRSVIDCALGEPHVRGITLQPVFASGRFDLEDNPRVRPTAPDIVSRICEARHDLFTRDAFTNLPCSHPNCAIVAYFFRASGRLWPLAKEIVPDNSLRDRIDFTLEDLMRCGCESTELGQYIRTAELSAENSFRIVIKPFMDRFTLNRARTELCCTHVVGPDGRLMSFCEYNVFRSRLEWNQNAADGGVARSTDSGTGVAAGRARLRMVL